jgi:hypothetical protein
MTTSGVMLGVDTLRFTELHGGTVGDNAILGKHLIRCNLNVLMEPVIKTGETKKFYKDCGCIESSYKRPDTFLHFEFELTSKGWRYLWNFFKPDRELERMLDRHCAVEFWTAQMVGEGRDFHQDPTYPWIHWVFPSTTWLRGRRGRWTGRSHPDGPKMKPEDYPADTLAMTDGGWWKTALPPPERSSR